MLKTHPWLGFYTLNSQKKHLWVKKNRKDGDQFFIDHDPIYAEDNPQVWAPEPYNSTFYNEKSVKKWPFSNLKTEFDDFFDVWASGWRGRRPKKKKKKKRQDITHA